MPPRRAVSPLQFETCEPLDSDPDGRTLPGSDDELTESQRAAQRRRIEKLGEAYLGGAPLFILSASLRGPLDRGWVNPWKKDRTKASGKGHKRPTEQPVIPETNSRKRRQYDSPSVIPASRSPAILQASSRTKSAREHGVESGLTDQARELKSATSTQSPRFTRHQHTDTGWLKKDKGSRRFRDIDPPTSPTTGISSRHMKRAIAPSFQSANSTGLAGYESAKTLHSQQHMVPQAEPASEPGSEANIAASDQERQTPGSKVHKDSSQLPSGARSIHVVSSSSQLPKFEYRLKRRRSAAKGTNWRSLDPTEDDAGEPTATGGSDSAFPGPENRHESPSVRSAEPGHDDSKGQPNLNNPSTSANDLNTVEDALSAGTDQELARNMEIDTTSENNLPSAQQAQEAPGNRPPDNVTSLYSIAASKATSNRAEDHNADHQFSTQAALMMAQKSFQNDLQSPELSPVTLTKKSHALNHESPNSINITPFHKMNNPDKGATTRSGGQQDGGMPIVSTQYMIDAATPFTFSTEKKAEFRMLSSEKSKSKTKNRKTTSFALSSPSEIPSELFSSDQDENENADQGQPAEHRESPTGSQQSALPLTLTGTTPPTAQEGQGVESFDLSQAIAEAGSWLQQSFEINKDITHCRTTKTSQPYPPNSTNSA